MYIHHDDLLKFQIMLISMACQTIDCGKLAEKTGKHLYWCAYSMRSYIHAENATRCDAIHTCVAAYRNTPIEMFSGHSRRISARFCFF